MAVNSNSPKGVAINGNEVYNSASGGSGIAPQNVSNFECESTLHGFKILWKDPDNTMNHDGSVYCNWKGTRIIYRKGTERPLNETDGTVAIDNTTRNQYRNSYYKIDNLDLGATYSIGCFPYSNNNIYNTNEVNCFEVTQNFVSNFATISDADLVDMLQEHYEGKIDISNYWHVGDTRVVHLSAMSAGTGGNETHVAQDMVMTIIGINHDNLQTPINDRTKAAITLQCREILGNNGGMEWCYIWGSSTSTDINSNYKDNPRRTWLNSTFLGALPTKIKQQVKYVTKKNLANHTDDTAGANTQDKVFLPSYSEMFGNASNSSYKGNTTLEGSQYSYYNSNERRIKYVNSNGEPGMRKNTYWLRSPSSAGKTYWMYVDDLGAGKNATSDASKGLAPCFCL